jgi:hypothetical protein
LVTTDLNLEGDDGAVSGSCYTGLPTPVDQTEGQVKEKVNDARRRIGFTSEQAGE